MSRELEAFVRLEQNSKRYKGRKEDLDTIFTALKDYEMEHTLRVRLENINYELVREKQENDKKLGQLEDIEEELGIGLIVLAKIIITQKVFVKGWKDKIEEKKVDRLFFDDSVLDEYTKIEHYRGIVVDRCCYDYLFEQYGKSWSLTKEELL